MRQTFNIRWIGFGILVFAGLFFLGQCFRLNVLPWRYLLGLSLLLGLGLLLGFVLTKRIKQRFSKGVLVFVQFSLALSLFYGGFSIARAVKTMQTVSGKNQKTYTMSLVVLKDGDIQSVTDLKGGKIALNTTADTERMNPTMEVLKETLSEVTFDIQNSYATLWKCLSEKQVAALLVNEAYRGMLEEEEENFSSLTKVIWQYEISSDVETIRKAVDVTNTPFTIFVSGIDTYGAISTVSRSDVNMLVTINPNTSQILLTSIPRDAWVKLDNLDSYDKLTHAGIAGIDNSVKTVENFLGTEINYYLRVNFSSLVALVDALDGIDVYSDRAFTAYTDRSVVIREGKNHLDGKAALAYARERHAYDDLYEDNERGDQKRVENQQAVLKGIIEKLSMPSILPRYNQILDTVAGMFETNMSYDELTALARLQFNEQKSWQIFNIKVNGTYEYRYGGAYMPDWHLIYYIPTDTSVQSAARKIAAVLNNQRITG